MTPKDEYQKDLVTKGYIQDSYQLLAVEKTQKLYEKLIAKQSFVDRLLNKLSGKKYPAITGLYLWGGTGRGKTYLMDSLYKCLPGIKKNRVHFHRFMLDIHERLKKLPRSPDPLSIIAAQIADDIQVLFLDEFHVHDIADAMLLSVLLQEIFVRNVVLVATSNIAIKDLYLNGLQRDRFLAAINLLHQFTEEINLESDNDYRFNILNNNERYYLITDSNGVVLLENEFNAITPCPAKTNRSISMNNRYINYIACADDNIWFDFSEICLTPRSAHDYIKIAEIYSTVFISDVRQMSDKDDAAAKRFIHLIDALYDHNVKVVISAEVVTGDLYIGQRLKFAFARTISRLTEMSTDKYLSLAHNPTGSARSVSDT